MRSTWQLALQNVIDRTPLLLLTLFYLGGILLNHYLQVPFFLWWIALIVSVLFETLFSNKFNHIIMILIPMLLLGGLNHSRHSSIGPLHLNQYVLSQKPAVFRGMVEHAEATSNDRLKIRLSRIERIAEVNTKLDGKLLISIASAKRVYQYGDFLEFQTTLLPPKVPRNPFEFNYKQYLSNHHIYAVSFFEADSAIRLLDSRGNPCRRFANQLRLQIQAKLDQSTTGEANAILTALILGIRNEISDETEEIFINSGVIHVLAVSGLHVGYVTLVFLFIFGILRFPPKIKVVLTIAALVCYAMMIDFKPSVTRAAIMAACILIGQNWEKRLNIYNAIALAALVQLLIDPFQLYDIGFQLSFLAVLSIVYIYQRLIALLPAYLTPAGTNSVFLKRTLQLFFVSLAAQLGTLPITLYYFQRISLVAVFANLFVIPLISIIGALGFAQVILGFIWNGFNIIYGEVQMLLIGLLQRLVQFSGNLPFAYLRSASISPLVLIVCYLFLFALLNAERRKVRVYSLIAMLIIGNLITWSSIFKTPKLELTFLDVGQGDAAFIHLPTGQKMLIDTGDKTFSRDYGRWVIAPFLQQNNIHKLDYLILTHPHSDHIGGAVYLLENFKIEIIYETQLVSDSKIFTRIHVLADSLQVPIQTMYAGDMLYFDETCQLFCIFPSQSFLEIDNLNYNNHSLVHKLCYRDQSILFTGDVELEAEEYLFHWNDFLKSDILKVPHHGSATSSSDKFINLVDPDYAVISVGINNKFNHPDQGTLEKYRRNQTQIFRTDEHGAMQIHFRDSQYKINSILPARQF